MSGESVALPSASTLPNLHVGKFSSTKSHDYNGVFPEGAQITIELVHVYRIEVGEFTHEAVHVEAGN